MEYANQREQTARRIEIHADLAFQPFFQELGCIIVDTTTGHVDGLDLLRRGLANRLEVAVADRKIFADRPAEPGQANDDRFQQVTGLCRNVECQPALFDAQGEFVGPGIVIGIIPSGFEMIAFEQIEDRNASLLLDIGIAPDDRMLVELNVYDPRVGHRVRLSGVDRNWE